MKTGIYKIISPSGKIYIGQSQDIEKRFYKYPSSAINQIKLYNSFNKYGKCAHKFEILEECKLEKLNIRERHWQDFYDVMGPNGLNCILTSTNEKTKVMSQETKDRISNSQSGKKHSEETKKKISLKSRGRFNRKVIDTETGEVFDSLKDAALFLNIKYKALHSMVSGKYKNKTNIKYYEKSNI